MNKKCKTLLPPIPKSNTQPPPPFFSSGQSVGTPTTGATAPPFRQRATAPAVVSQLTPRSVGMDTESNDVDMEKEIEDDEVQILETPTSTPTSKSTPGTSVDCGSTIGTTRLGVNENGDMEVSKKPKSDVWLHFDKPCMIDNVPKCKCKHCHGWYSCKASNGTTHLKRHIKSCFKTPKFQDVGSMFDNRAAFLTKWKFDAKVYRDKLARAIIKHDLPFTYAEYDGVNELNACLNPEFKAVSRNTARNDCMKVFEMEKDKLKKLLAAHSGRICLTSDVWTAVTTVGYMSVTALFVDENWMLNSKLLSFVELDTAHSGLELSGKLLEVLKDWGIESKIFSLTLDNATSNDSMVRFLKDRLNLQNSLLCGGEFFHVRCAAHILNLIVQEGLKTVEDALKRIRNSVKYVKATDGRLREFQKCIEEVHLTDIGGGFLKLDVSTRWNSTYLMLDSAIKYRKAFTSLSYNDTNYKYCPTNEEWERGQRICEFLEPFYTITREISGSSYPTSNLYFMQVAQIEMKLNEFAGSTDEVIKDMALRMKKKFDKYWEDYCATLVFGSILDPNSKLKFLTFCYKILYPQDYEGKVKKIRDLLYKLFGEYDKIEIASRCPTITPRETLPQSQPHASTSRSSLSFLDLYNQELNEEESTNGENELDLYLEERFKPFAKLSVLEYWKVNANRFPRLARMARDILSIPITTVASESTFSIGGRILQKYRNCMLPDTVQALICTRNWLHGFKEVKTSGNNYVFF
ncbi:zinc finger BED domain-containing protein RICESLEEPER 2-like [Salvia miltiorrhiza]|uniref:zinc finger BED domain-containing protein RICESLEEPER 2-like n=1 Tax=Salvia miltiorrhiza TaxID=226208 RepID=UPI0025ACB9FD|nr:zinc finger BED domain-containing protein RICESLEEPER 2-like [Salvia miltiorrhiza]